MKRSLVSIFLVALTALAVAADRAGDAVIKQIEALQSPAWENGKENDPAWMKAYMAKRKEYGQKRNDLIWKLYKTDPSHPKTAALMEQRWDQFEQGSIDDLDAYVKRVFADIDKVLAEKPSPAIRESGLYIRALHLSEKAGRSGGDVLVPVDAFLKEFPQSQKGEQLLLMASYNTSGEKRRPVYQRFLTLYPKSKFAGMITGALRQSDAMGKPFALKFTDAVGGKPIDMAAMRGKVVLVDFWATWCGPCVAKMPELKSLYAQLHPKGLEMIGVSLDMPEAEGGLKALKAFVQKNAVPWPQYYQGKGWEGDFSTSWGIMSVPTVFLIDKKGNLRSINPGNLRTEIEKLLAE